MSSMYVPQVQARRVRHRTIDVQNIQIAYREAGDPSHPKLVLLHGWPSSSHQFRELLPALADRFHVIAPDYPGFGDSGTPDRATFAYTFDHLAEIVTEFLAIKGFTRYGLFVQDYGGPVGYRVLTRNPDALEWLTIQNTNTYEVGFSEAWAGLRGKLWMDRNAESEALAAGLLTLEVFKATYVTGSTNPEVLSPDSWTMDFYKTMHRPDATQIQVDLFYDYRKNVALYPQWQQFLREHQPKTVIFWGQDDLFFTRAGGEAYLQDLPQAQLHRLAAGHFATEDCLEYIAAEMIEFYDNSVAEAKAATARVL